MAAEGENHLCAPDPLPRKADLPQASCEPRGVAGRHSLRQLRNRVRSTGDEIEIEFSDFLPVRERAEETERPVAIDIVCAADEGRREIVGYSAKYSACTHVNGRLTDPSSPAWSRTRNSTALGNQQLAAPSPVQRRVSQHSESAG
jgi:hypothetical protein